MLYLAKSQKIIQAYQRQETGDSSYDPDGLGGRSKSPYALTTKTGANF